MTSPRSPRQVKLAALGGIQVTLLDGIRPMKVPDGGTEPEHRVVEYLPMKKGTDAPARPALST